MIGLAEDWESECGGQQSGAGSESAFVRRGHYGEEAPIRTRMDGHGGGGAGRRDYDITEIDITESDVAEFDITENDITESDITETNIT